MTITPALVAAIVADALGFTVSDLRARGRGGSTRARQIAWYVTVETTGASYGEVGRWYGGFRRQTVYEAVRDLEATMARNDWTRATVHDVMARVRGRGE